MKTRLYHARILPLGKNNEITSGEVIIEDGVIVSVGAPREATDSFDREIDCRGGLLMPGFKNAHTHSGMTFLRSMADDLPLQAWLTQQVFPKEAQLTEEDLYILTKLAILEYLSGGVTSMFDMYYFRESIAKAAVDTGFRTVLVGEANDYGGSAERTVQEYERFNHYDPLVSYQLGFHAEYTTSRKLLESLAEVVRALKQPFYTHLNETKAEVEGCLNRNGLRPIEYLDSLGLFEYGGGGYHCVHVSEREMEILRERGMYVITCPASNMKLGSGVAPIAEFLERGIPVAIGTDGPASNNALDLFREMYLVSGLQKLRHGPETLDATRVLHMACSAGARACGLPDCDALAVGKQADIILIDLDAPNMQPLNNIAKNIVYSGGKQNVRMTMIAGRVLYLDGEYYIGDDPMRIYEQAQRIVERMR